MALDGIIRPVDDPFWRTHAPLNGYRCRCGLISLTEAQAKARSGNGAGLNKAVDDIKMQPDKGWDYSPRGRLFGVEQALVKRQEQSGGVLFSALNQLLAQDMKIIELEGFDRVQEKIAAIAQQRPEWFPLGFSGINAVSNQELFAGFDPDKGLFYVSAVDELLPGFNPAKELSDAMAKIAQGGALTFNNEYAVETPLA